MISSEDRILWAAAKSNAERTAESYATKLTSIAALPTKYFNLDNRQATPRLGQEKTYMGVPHEFMRKRGRGQVCTCREARVRRAMVIGMANGGTSM